MLLTLTGLLMLAFVGAMALQVYGMLGMVRFYFKKPPRLDPSKPLPSVTIVKACHLAEDGEAKNFEGFFKQRYAGQIQLLFVVDNESVPVAPIIREALARNPNRPNFTAEMLTVKEKRGIWGKMDALVTGHAHAKGDLILWSDSDAIVGPDYVEQMAASFQNPETHVVTTPQYEVNPTNFATALKVAGNYADIAVYGIGVESLQKNKGVGWGHSLAFRRADYESHRSEIEEKLLRTFADDQVVPKVLASHGKPTVFKNIYCPVRYSNKSLEQVFVQKERWAQCQKGFFPNDLVYLAGMFTYPEIPAFFLVLLSGFAPLHVLMLLMAAGLRTLIAFFFEVLFLENFAVSRRWFWVVPIWDLLQIYFFVNAYFTKTMRIQGVEYRIVQRLYLEKNSS